MDLLALQNSIRSDDILASAHALSEAIADSLPIDEVWTSLLAQGVAVIEDYPNDPRGPSCLMLSFVQGRPVHTVVAYPCKRQAVRRQVAAVAYMITVYRPDLRPHEWSADHRTRLPNP